MLHITSEHSLHPLHKDHDSTAHCCALLSVTSQCKAVSFDNPNKWLRHCRASAGPLQQICTGKKDKHHRCTRPLPISYDTCPTQNAACCITPPQGCTASVLWKHLPSTGKKCRTTCSELRHISNPHGSSAQTITLPFQRALPLMTTIVAQRRLSCVLYSIVE